MKRLWTPELDVVLRELCDGQEKLPAAAIAIVLTKRFRLVPRLTKGAVVSRVSRLKAVDPSWRLPIIANPRGPQLQPDPDNDNDEIANDNEIILPPPRQEPPPLPDNRLTLFEDEFPDDQGVLLANAAIADCRMPLNDPGRGNMINLRVCGEPSVRWRGTTGYCLSCYQLMYGAKFKRNTFVLRSIDAIKSFQRGQANETRQAKNG